MAPTERRNGRLSFAHITRYSAVCLLLLLATSRVVTAQADAMNQEAPVQLRLKLDKDTIMLGEPLYISFEVTNLSGEKLCLGIGGDYRNRFGRPNRFNVSVSRDDGSELPQLDVVNFGGFVGCALIEAGDTYTVRLFLSDWANIERTGSYRINVKRTMSFSSYDPSDAKNKYSMRADLNADFVVVPADENKMGGIINSLGSIMLDISNPRADESACALASIQDKRVISYFAEALRKLRDSEFDFDHLNKGNIRNRAIFSLGRYDDDRAIEALKEAMNSRIDDTRLEVATAFGDSPHNSAIKLLLKMQDDKYWFVRLRVAQGLDKVKTKESLATLQKLLKDEDEHVRDAAKESLKKTTQ